MSVETAIEYAGWEIVLDETPPFIAIGFHADGVSVPDAVGGESDSVADEVENFSGGWVLLENDGDGEYEVIDGTDEVVGYGGELEDNEL